MASFGDSEDIGTTNPVGGRMREQSLSPTENDQLVALFAKHWQISPDEAAAALASSSPSSSTVRGAPTIPARALEDSHGGNEPFGPFAGAPSPRMDIKPRRTPSVMAEGSDNGYRRPPLDSQLKSSGMITKLRGGDTWQVWKIQMFNLVQTAPNAEEILTGEIQESDPDYSLAMDIALGSLIGQTVQVDALGSLALSINGPKREKRGSALYAILRSPHERTDEATQRQMLGTLATLRQNGISLDSLFQLLNVTFSKAFSAGIELTKGMRRSYLMSSLDPRYGVFVSGQNSMSTAGINASYDATVRALLVEEDRLRLAETEAAHANAAKALAAFNANGSQSSRNRSKDKSGKSSGSKAKGGGESSSKSGGEKKSRSLPNDGKCFRCDQMGHLASACPFPPATGSK